MTRNLRVFHVLGVLIATPILVGTGCPFALNLTPSPGNGGLTGKFVGSERCSQCHQSYHTSWADTLHAKALDHLEAVGQGTNAACLVCHTVGFGQEGGFKDRAMTNALAGVGCESCHGAAGDHVANVSDVTLRPTVSLSAEVCGKCHTGEHQPNFDDWMTSKHAASAEPSHLTAWAAGTAGNLTNCGKCHSGDYFFHKIIKGETNDKTGKPVDDKYLMGVPAEQMTRITCAICHNPHAKTGNAATPEDGRDYQLRYPQIKFATPTTDLTAAQDPTRFNICGQCHHTRDRVWTDSSREPHPSDQANVFFGEMPLPAAFPEPIVPSRPSVHLNTPAQCSTCHVARTTAKGGIAPQVSGHTFKVNFLGCVQCHNSTEIAMAKLDGLKAEFDFRSKLVEDALNAWAARTTIEPGGTTSNATWCADTTAAGAGAHTGPCWEFTSEGGPSSTRTPSTNPVDNSKQSKIPNNIKKARYIYYYVRQGGGSGAHNPDYVREALIRAEEYARNAPDHLP